ncbi:DUF5994 family protein [Nocardioides iriomotensis]|uniref:DUF5994 family protein n=1 Tax=Nocardioides iriomotensis TaxID=715784 RepID=UPI003B833FD3
MTSHTASESVASTQEDKRHRLRLELSPSPGQSPVDGAWWPRTRDIDLELADLVDHFPDHLGRIYRALYSRSDWTSHPRSVATARRRIRTAAFPRDDTHLILLSFSTRRSLRLLVVPPGHATGERLMQWATHPLNRLTGAQLLSTRAESEDDDEEFDDLWSDVGGNWWQGSRAPSFRTDPPAEGDPPPSS